MLVQDFIALLDDFAPQSLQESYDNCGLLLGSPTMPVHGVLVSIDITEEVVEEALMHHCNLIISHHPLIFKALKHITMQTYTERCVVKLLKNDIAVIAAHTNFDNVLDGVNAKIADVLALENRKVLLPLANSLLKLVTYVPLIHAPKVREALFAAGAGEIGNYDACSFNVEGYGTFRANSHAHPFVGETNQLHTEHEVRMEVILPRNSKNAATSALLKAHPYEEPAYDFFAIENTYHKIGAGLIAELPEPMDALALLKDLKQKFQCDVIRHSRLLGRKINKVALCGGSGSFLLKEAINQGADIFISGDFKYHEFFDAENKILIADLGHFETEQFTKHIFYELITKKMPTFAVRISEIKTNPINYL
ncbi:MAG: Nif3-like dinuclear metal center hexameric protein [Porphyromonadaceae bacterium CG2_30_38_12]|nr:MAG: Nif3-like dinuclear metal center hexameric protein [Porphyromonadaceae bacterium CG2_30_38_12]